MAQLLGVLEQGLIYCGSGLGVYTHSKFWIFPI